MGNTPENEEIDSADFEDLPSTDVVVDYHIHFGMSGSFPLQLADLFVADDGLYIAEYAYIMPLFGLGTRKHHREANAMQEVYDVHGLDEVLLQADQVMWHSHENVEQIDVYDGGRLGRPKISVHPVVGQSHVYRLHDDIDFGELTTELDTCGERYGFAVAARDGIGIRLRASVDRLLNR
jgi:hypothetical protein